MTARKLPHRETLAVFFYPGCAPAPAPRQRMARPLAIKQGEGAPPSEKSPPCRAWGCRAGLFQGSLRIPPLERGLAGSASPREREPPAPEKNGEGPVP